MSDKIANVIIALILVPLLVTTGFMYTLYVLIFGVEGKTARMTLQIGKREFRWERPRATTP